MAEIFPERAEVKTSNIHLVCEEAFSRAYQAELSVNKNDPDGHYIVREAGMKERIRLQTDEPNLDINVERLTLYSSPADSWWVAFWVNRIDTRPPQEINSHPARLLAHAQDMVNLFRAGQDGEYSEPISLEEAEQVKKLINTGQPVKIHPSADLYF